MTGVGLTKSLRQGLDFIRSCILQFGVPPSYREIANHMGFASIAAASRLVHLLVERGYITMRKGEARSIALVRSIHEITVDLPVDVDSVVHGLVESDGLTREAALIVVARAGVSAIRSQKVSRETPSVVDPLPATSSRPATSPRLAGSSIR